MRLNPFNTRVGLALGGGAAKGIAHILDYQMVETENGWKINGVQMLEQDGVNA
jgi:predicted acylesterase/phospholipase RssA